MRLLLDTHIWLWSLLEPERLGRAMKRALQDEDNELWLSAISIWEVVVLAERRRVVLQPDVQSWIESALRAAPLLEAPLTHEIAIATQDVTLPHRDPADRFLVATARVHGLTFATADERLIGVKGISVLANR